MNPIMIDGTGMCGGCRLTVGGKTKFACVDGPDFDGHEVDFDEAMHRGTMYRDFEAHAREAECEPADKRRSNDRCRIWTRKRCPMPVQDPDVRNKNFKEVALGYTYEMAVNEAKALPELQKQALCERLPGEHRYSRALSRKVADEDMEGAYAVLSRVQRAAGGVRPRVPAGEPVRGQMRSRHQNGEPVGIGRLERFVADWHREHSTEKPAIARAQRAQGGGHRLRPVRADGWPATLQSWAIR